MYAAYIKERENKEMLQFDCGFITYKIYPENKECFLADMYIDPKHRGTNAVAVFVNDLARVAKESGCDHISATVCVDSGASRVLKAAFKLDFKIKNAQNNIIVIVKDLKGA